MAAKKAKYPSKDIKILNDYKISSLAFRYYEKINPGKYKGRELQAAKNFTYLRYIDLNILQQVIIEIHEEQMESLKKTREFPSKKPK